MQVTLLYCCAFIAYLFALLIVSIWIDDAPQEEIMADAGTASPTDDVTKRMRRGYRNFRGVVFVHFWCVILLLQICSDCIAGHILDHRFNGLCVPKGSVHRSRSTGNRCFVR